MESTHHPFHSFYILYLRAHIYVSMCFNIYVSTEARVAGSCTSYGPDTVPFTPHSSLPPWCFAPFFLSELQHGHTVENNSLLPKYGAK